MPHVSVMMRSIGTVQNRTIRRAVKEAIVNQVDGLRLFKWQVRCVVILIGKIQALIHRVNVLIRRIKALIRRVIILIGRIKALIRRIVVLIR